MNKQVLCVVLGVCFLSSSLAGPAVDSTGHLDNSVHANEHTSVEDALLKKLNNKCSDRDVSSCLMLKLVTYFNRMLKKSSIEFGDIAITQTSVETIKEEAPRSLNDANMSEEAQLTQVISDKVWSFLRTRSLKWKMMDEADLVVSGNTDKDGSMNLGLSLKPTKSAGEARKKGNNNMGAIIAAAAMKIGLLKALAFKALVLLVGKALLVSKLALVLAAIIGLKKLLHHEKHVTYEVVAHPHHEHHEHAFSSSGGSYEGHGGWGRNFEAQNLAYKAHAPTN